MRQRGFTLIELLFAVLILAVLATLALPSFRTFIGDQRLKTASFELQSVFLLARSEAIKRGMGATVVISATDATNKDWGQGWSVAAGTQNLARQGAFEAVSIAEKNTLVSVTYNGEGRVTAASPVEFTLSLPADGNVRSRCVRIDLTGMPVSRLSAGGGCS